MVQLGRFGHPRRRQLSRHLFGGTAWRGTFTFVSIILSITWQLFYFSARRCSWAWSTANSCGTAPCRTGSTIPIAFRASSCSSPRRRRARVTATTLALSRSSRNRHVSARPGIPFCHLLAPFYRLSWRTHWSRTTPTGVAARHRERMARATRSTGLTASRIWTVMSLRNASLLSFHHWSFLISNRTEDVMVPLTNASQTDTLDSCLTNKLHRLSLATFDDEGKCLSQSSLRVER